MKDHLIFDTTNATTIADSDSVGAYVRSSDGTLITHTTVGGKDALDVNVVDGINVEVDLSHVDDSVALGDGTNLFTSTTVGADIGLDVYLINSSIAVTATDLDIRDLTQADEITVYQGTDPWIIGDGGNSITVDASDLDIRDLTHVSDSIRLGDGTNFLTSTTIGADVGLDVNIINTIAVNDAALANTAIASAAETLDAANTAQDVIVSPLANRKYVYIYNNDNQKMWIGQSGVTSANGFPVSPGSYMELRAGAAIDIEFVSTKINHEIRTLELS
jgi:hypothetical protein